jgi:hypothetical protein
MGSLLSEIETSKRKTGPKRRIDEIMAQLSAEDALDLRTALDDHTVPQAAICRALGKRGHHLSQSVISKYRNGMMA